MFCFIYDTSGTVENATVLTDIFLRLFRMINDVQVLNE